MESIMSRDSWRRVGVLVLIGTLLASAGAARAAGSLQFGRTIEPNATSCILIRTAQQLQAMNKNRSADYCLANDIDLSSISNFTPVGDEIAPFTGRFFGNNHVIRNLTINTNSIQQVGLFGAFNGITIRDVTLLNVNI